MEDNKIFETQETNQEKSREKNPNSSTNEPIPSNENITGENQNINPETETNNSHNNNTETQELMSKIQELEKQLSDLNDKHIRLLAEFDNFRKRTRKEKEDLIKYAGEEIWKKILPVLDDFERAIKENQNTSDIDIVKKGFELIYNKTKQILTQNNITPIDCLNKEFNADTMEAVAKVPAPSEELKGKVIEELEKAYQLNDKIIRFAKVIVAE